ncbi:hypothetical protein CR973_01165 [Candidatus Saccharibacteria bacterium]|nr:MAG: hypothetical protein CR973_01165 [Candidatus Saccharibacteria bacterium]
MSVYDDEQQDNTPDDHNDPGVQPTQVHDRPPENSNTPGAPSSAEQPGAPWWDPRKWRKETAARAKDLKDQEERPDSKYGNSALGDIQERLGLGFTGKGSQKDDRLAKSFKGKSNIRKRLAVATAAAGVGGGSAALIFFLMLPLKVGSFVGMIEGKAMASTQEAMQRGISNAFGVYLGKHVMRALGTPGCKKSIDPGCVVVVSGTTPIAKMYQAWSQSKLQQELGKKHGIIIGKNTKTNKFYMTVNGHSIGNDAQFLKLQKGEISLFDLDAKEVKRSDIRRAINTALREGTLWDKTYKRYQYGKLLERRFHVKRCLMACDIRDKFTDKKEAKLLAGKLWLTQKVSGVAGETYGLLIDCIMDPDFCDATITPSTDPREEPKSRFHRELDTKLKAYIRGPGAEKLGTLVTRAKDINKLGFSGYLSSKIGEKLGQKLGFETAGKATGKAIGRVIPYAGQISLLISIKNFVSTAPAFMKYMSYETNAATAASMFAMYQSSAGELKSGNIDLTAAGSLADTLSEGQDMTTHPIYESYFGKTVAQNNVFTSFGRLIGTASAQAPNSLGFICDDGNPIPQGMQICPEEDFTNAGDAANVAYDVRHNPFVEGYFNFMAVNDAVLNGINDIYLLIEDGVGGVANLAFEKTCIGPCKTLLDWGKQHIGDAVQWIIDHLKPNPFLNLSGGRILAMSTAGAQVTFEKAAMLETGAAPITNTAYTRIQNQYLADERANFREKSLLARLTSTETPYSLTSQLALRLPARSSIPSASIASLFTGPAQRLGAGLGSLFSAQKANAVTTGTSSPFGVKHFGYGASEIPSDPEKYWNDRCANRSFEKEFLDSMEQDPDTGEATPNKPEPCLLIRSIASSAGGMFDAGLLPTGSFAGTTSIDSNSSSIDQSELFASSESLGCADGTRDLGIVDGYNDGQKIPIRICAVSGFKSTSSESNGGGGVVGAHGDLVVNARISANTVAMFKDAKASGLTLSAASGYRSMQHSIELCDNNAACRACYRNNSCNRNSYYAVAKPGDSNHQMGIAIDFAGTGIKLVGASCNNRVKDPSSPVWNWLYNNAEKYGFRQLAGESWHWDPIQSSSRCAGGGS